ncbi:serine hydrolase domain-containing protein [Nocardia altamirensis]|uniref:serine hydrolase domain-containing protein n=1 Tax=Nocardia altamirensis TaxID=472158 RepID=UPI000840742B|nr:serine hydrolase domain-containing protein [Nocardia altamirensis]
MRFAPVIAAVSGLVLLAGCASDSQPEPESVVSDTRIRAVQADIDGLVGAGVTGMIATVTENGKTVALTSGVADTATRATIPTDPPQQVRVGSINKSFTSAIVLQLVAEGRIRLDEPIDTYLPGVVHGQGIDGRAITVRQILRHQSGLPDFATDERVDEYRAALQNRIMTPDEALAIIMSKPADFAPGARFAYSNSNYAVAGVLIERVTGARYADELDRRILKPLALNDTYFPAAGEHDIRGPHPKGYAEIDGVLTDVTRIEPSVPWAGGALVSTGADLNRFYAALLSGKVVPAAELQEMRNDVVADEGLGLDERYGLGTSTARLPCGAESFGHTGGIYGYIVIAGATVEGRAVTYAFTKEPKALPDLTALLSHALCP